MRRRAVPTFWTLMLCETPGAISTLVGPLTISRVSGSTIVTNADVAIVTDTCADVAVAAAATVSSVASSSVTDAF